MKKILIVFGAMFLAGCISPQSQMKVNEGVYFETGKSRTEVIDAVVQVFTEEGYDIDNINKEYGLVTTKILAVPTGVVYTKIGDPGASLMGGSMHKVNVSATVTKTGGLKIKTTATSMYNPNFLATARGGQSEEREEIDIRSSIKLNEYYLQKVKERL